MRKQPGLKSCAKNNLKMECIYFKMYRIKYVQTLNMFVSKLRKTILNHSTISTITAFLKSKTNDQIPCLGYSLI